ncbi:MAG: hypothetical protein U0271_15065 [Polyangiaceae bacterium]
MTKLRVVASLAALSLTLFNACTDPPPKAKEPVATASATASATVSADMTPNKASLDPVPVPSGVVARGRVKSVKTILLATSGMSGGDPSMVDKAARVLLAQLLQERRALRLDVDGLALAEQIELNGPVDAIVTMGDGAKPKINIAFAFDLTSLEAARDAAGASAADGGNGTWLIGGEKAHGLCALMPAVGKTNGRLVCGSGEDDINTLGPYLTRTAPTEALPTQDVLIDLDIASANERFGKQLAQLTPALPQIIAKKLGTGNKAFDTALEEGARTLTADLPALLGDVKKARLEGIADDKKGIDLTLSASFVDAPKSWLGKLAMTSPAHPAPDLFWRGPADASGAMFVNIGDPAAFGEITKALKKLALGALEGAGSDQERKKLADLAELPFAKDSVFVAYGGAGRITPAKKPANEKEKWQVGLDGTFGWYILGTNQNSKAWTNWLDAVVDGFNQPGIQKALKNWLGKSTTLTLSKGKAPKKLGAGAQAIDISFSDSDGQYTVAGAGAIVVLPDGDNTWVGIGFDKNELAERLLRAKDGQMSMKDRADAGALRDGETLAAIFGSLRSLRGSIVQGALMSTPDNMNPADALVAIVSKVDGFFDQLPAKGNTPVVIKTSREGSNVVVRGILSKEVLADLNVMGQKAAEAAQRGQP